MHNMMVEHASTHIHTHAHTYILYNNVDSIDITYKRSNSYNMNY